MLEPRETELHPLVCVECAAVSDDQARGWQALQADDEVAVYCPECAAREFDG